MHYEVLGPTTTALKSKLEANGKMTVGGRGREA